MKNIFSVKFSYKKDLDHVLQGKLDKAETLCTATQRSYTVFGKKHSTKPPKI